MMSLPSFSLCKFSPSSSYFFYVLIKSHHILRIFTILSFIIQYISSFFFIIFPPFYRFSIKSHLVLRIFSMLRHNLTIFFVLFSSLCIRISFGSKISPSSSYFSVFRYKISLCPSYFFMRLKIPPYSSYFFQIFFYKFSEISLCSSYSIVKNLTLFFVFQQDFFKSHLLPRILL